MFLQVKTKTKITQVIILSVISVATLSAGALLAFQSPTDQLIQAGAIINSSSPENGEFFNGEKTNPNISNVSISQPKDSDQDGLTDEEERRYGTNPYAKDSDNDGMSDGEEVAGGFSPTESNTQISDSAPAEPQASDPLADDDNDGLSNALEDQYGTDKNNPDTDGDGYLDGAEVQNGYDPNNPLPVKLLGAQISAGSAVLFIGEGCPHCAVVKDYLEKNNIKAKVNLEEKEVYNNTANLNDLAQASSICSIPQEQVAVPLLFSNGKCYTGEDEIINYLKQFISVNVASSNNTATLSATVNANSALTPEEQDILNMAEPKALPEISDTEIIVNPQTSQANLKQYFTEVENAVKTYLLPLQEQVSPDGSAEISKEQIIANVQNGYQAMKIISVPAEAKEFHKLTMSIFKAYESLANLKQEDFSTLEALQSETLNQVLGVQMTLGEFNKQGEALASKYSIELN